MEKYIAEQSFTLSGETVNKLRVVLHNYKPGDRLVLGISDVGFTWKIAAGVGRSEDFCRDPMCYGQKPSCHYRQPTKRDHVTAALIDCWAHWCEGKERVWYTRLGYSCPVCGMERDLTQLHRPVD